MFSLQVSNQPIPLVKHLQQAFPCVLIQQPQEILKKTPTPLKINMSPEKGPFQKETGLPTGDMLIFAGVPSPTKI